MTWNRAVFFTALIALVTLTRSTNLTEELHITPLQRGFASITSHFTAKESFQSKGPHILHFTAVPKLLGKIVTGLNLEYFELSFSAGHWKTKQWGPRPDHGHAPAGFSLLASFKNDLIGTQQRWDQLTQALSGLFCGAISSLDYTKQTVSPSKTFGSRPGSSARAEVRYGILSREVFCTENFAAWLKLLPCHHQAGFGSLLDPRTIFGSQYHSMHVRVEQEAASVGSTVTVSQTIRFVVEKSYAHNKQDAKISIAALFAGSMPREKCKHFRRCAVANYSAIHLSKPFWVSESLHKPKTTTLDISAQRDWDLCELSLLFPQFDAKVHGVQPHINLEHYISPRGSERGLITTKLSNPYLNESLNISLLEIVPWYVKVYFHTLDSRKDGKSLATTMQNLVIEPSTRIRNPHVLEFCTILPAASELSVSYEYRTAFLPLDDFPHDPNHGFDLLPAVVEVAVVRDQNKTAIGPFEHAPLLEIVRRATAAEYPKRIFSQSVILDTPKPDFSMPFNVLCLTATIVTMFSSSIISSLVWQEYKPKKLGKAVKIATACAAIATAAYFASLYGIDIRAIVEEYVEIPI